jgi:hypothetical protein
MILLAPWPRAQAEDISLLVLLTGTGNQGSSPNARFECMGETRIVGVSGFGTSVDFNRFNLETAAGGAGTITLTDGGTLWSAQLSVGILPECYANNYAISINGQSGGFCRWVQTSTAPQPAWECPSLRRIRFLAWTADTTAPG